jgi:hypothetical protein
MPLGDYFKGPEHKANAARLEAELQAHRHQSQVDIQALQAKYDNLETKARELGLLDLLAVKKKIQIEETRLVSVQAQVTATQTDLEAARSQLQEVQQQILGAEDTVQLESFALYEPKSPLSG